MSYRSKLLLDLFRSLAVQVSQWAYALQYYRQLRDSGLPIAGIRYEDLLADPETNMRRILRHCDLPEHAAVNSLRALKVDSQLNTPLSTASLQRIAAPPECSAETRADLDAICEFYGLPPFSQRLYFAPGTITAGAGTHSTGTQAVG